MLEQVNVTVNKEMKTFFKRHFVRQPPFGGGSRRCSVHIVTLLTALVRLVAALLVTVGVARLLALRLAVVPALGDIAAVQDAGQQDAAVGDAVALDDAAQRAEHLARQVVLDLVDVGVQYLLVDTVKDDDSKDLKVKSTYNMSIDNRYQKHQIKEAIQVLKGLPYFQISATPSV